MTKHDYLLSVMHLEVGTCSCQVRTDASFPHLARAVIVVDWPVGASVCVLVRCGVHSVRAMKSRRAVHFLCMSRRSSDMQRVYRVHKTTP
eukprot:3701140-Pleurochrysis_carterae.AAC.2